jgi:hypothetical protein
MGAITGAAESHISLHSISMEAIECNEVDYVQNGGGERESMRSLF